MLKGIEEGIITPERLDEAVTRVLALKAALGLHHKIHCRRQRRPKQSSDVPNTKMGGGSSG